MNIIFCSDPLQANRPDVSYEDEAQAAIPSTHRYGFHGAVQDNHVELRPAR